MAAIRFYSEHPSFTFRGKGRASRWLLALIRSKQREPGSISVVFVTDDALLEMNRKYLQHDDFTDIITFDYGTEQGGKVGGDLFISIDRAHENATLLHVKPSDELLRLLAHGTLHLLGYQDKSSRSKQIMTAQEEEALALFKQTQ